MPLRPQSYWPAKWGCVSRDQKKVSGARLANRAPAVTGANPETGPPSRFYPLPEDAGVTNLLGQTNGTPSRLFHRTTPLRILFPTSRGVHRTKRHRHG